MRKTLFGGVAVAGVLALFSATAVAASEATTSEPAQGELHHEGIMAEVENALVELEAAAVNEQEQEVEAPAPKAGEPELETEIEANQNTVEAPKVIEPAATPEPAEATEHHDGGDSGSHDSGSSN